MSQNLREEVLERFREEASHMTLAQLETWENDLDTMSTSADYRGSGVAVFLVSSVVRQAISALRTPQQKQEAPETRESIVPVTFFNSHLDRLFGFCRDVRDEYYFRLVDGKSVQIEESYPLPAGFARRMPAVGDSLRVCATWSQRFNRFTVTQWVFEEDWKAVLEVLTAASVATYRLIKYFRYDDGKRSRWQESVWSGTSLDFSALDRKFPKGSNTIQQHESGNQLVFQFQRQIGPEKWGDCSDPRPEKVAELPPVQLDSPPWTEKSLEEIRQRAADMNWEQLNSWYSDVIRDNRPYFNLAGVTPTQVESIIGRELRKKSSYFREAEERNPDFQRRSIQFDPYDRYLDWS